MPIDSRQYALNLLDRFDRYGSTLDRLIDDSSDDLGSLLKRDRDFIFALVFGVLRWRDQLDFYIQSISSRPLRKITPTILNILRLGTFQIIHMNRIPVSAAVNTAVELTKAIAPIWVTKFVNAILRNLARNHHQIQFPRIDKDPVPALATKYAYPEWMVKRWIDRFGVTETDALCNAGNGIPPITLRANTLQINRDQLVEQLKDHFDSIRPTAVSPDGLACKHPQATLTALPGFKQGLFQVQDEAAQLVSFLLSPKPGEVILDACAGVGGKTGHIAQLMGNNGSIIALDSNAGRLAALRAQMMRLKISIVKEIQYDLLGSASLPSGCPHQFDRILIDAPCSGMGVIRRNPDTKWRLSVEDLEKYGTNQLKLIESLSTLVKPAGRLVYAVCSNEAEETDAVLKRFLNRHPEFRLCLCPALSAVAAPDDLLTNGMLKTFPHRHRMDGFFAVGLKRTP